MRKHHWFDREGNPISIEEAEALLQDQEARIVGRTEVGRFTVSTVHLVLDHDLFRDHGRPILFETMIFSPKGFQDQQWRYHTEAEAKEGHDRVVKDLQAKIGRKSSERSH